MNPGLAVLLGAIAGGFCVLMPCWILLPGIIKRREEEAVRRFERCNAVQIELAERVIVRVTLSDLRAINAMQLKPGPFFVSLKSPFL